MAKSGYGANVNKVYCGSPTQADDIAIISLSPLGLQKLIDLCIRYSQSWRFKFNASKSKILTAGFSRQKLNLIKLNHKWYLGERILEIVDSYKHVGVLIQSSGSSKERTAEACAKGKRTFMAACGIGMHSLCPKSASKIYHSVILPRSLYGCELWHNLSAKEIHDLQVMQRYIAKRIQHFHFRCRSIIAIGMIGWQPIDKYIHEAKL